MWALYLDRQLRLEILPARLLPIFSFSDACGWLEFSSLHRAYLDRRSRSFGEVLQSVSRNEVDAQDRFGRTVLSWAAGQNNVEAVQNLLLCGANPNARDRCGETPLHHAAREDAARCVKLLLSAKADPLLMDASGYTPLDAASANWVTGILIAAGSRWGSHVSIFEESVLVGSDVDLYRAVMAGSNPKESSDLMRAWHDCAFHITSTDMRSRVVEVLTFYVALHLPFHAHLPLLESHLKVKPFRALDTPRIDDWSIYRSEQQAAPEACYVILRGIWDPANQTERRSGRKWTAFEEAAVEGVHCIRERAYVGPVGEQFERWYDKFKQRAAYIIEKQRRWKEYWGSEVWEGEELWEYKPPRPDRQQSTSHPGLEGSWGLGPHYEPRKVPLWADISDTASDGAKSWEGMSWESVGGPPPRGWTDRFASSERRFEELSEAYRPGRYEYCL